jgi:ABC-type nitrate/sulfonate/bicarbonate transport system permease component
MMRIPEMTNIASKPSSLGVGVVGAVVGATVGATVVGAIVGAAVGVAVGAAVGVGVGVTSPSSGILSPSATLPSSAIENSQ